MIYDVVRDLVAVQNAGDVSAFLNHLEKRNKRLDTRNVDLFKAFLRGEEELIKTEIGDNAYRALKKRLTDQLVEFLATRLLKSELNEENQVIKLIVVARKLVGEERIETAFVLFKRAEKKAIELDHYALLNEIYHSMIEHSHKTDKVNQEDLFRKLEQNNANFIAQERLSILYASMQKQFTSESFRARPSSFKVTYQESCAAFGLNSEMLQNFKNLNQLCVLADLYGSQTKRYHELDLFFEEEIANIQGTAKDTEKMLGYHIALMYGLANIYFRRKDTVKSLWYLEQMQNQMARFTNKHAESWHARYVNLLALNLNFTFKASLAEALLTETLTNKNLKETEVALLSLTLATVYFQKEELKEVKRILNALNKTDAWYLKNMGSEWLFNLRAMEVLLQYDLGNDELAESRTRSFQRNYGVLFKHETKNPIWPFLALVKSVLNKPEVLQTEEFAQKVEKAIPWKDKEEDVFNICYYAWLKAKMLKQPLYQTTLEIFNG